MSTADRRARLADVPAALLSSVDRQARRSAVASAEAPLPTGIDFVEVVPMRETMRILGSTRALPWRTLLVHLLRGPVPAAWDARRVAITGGVRRDPALNPVLIAWAYPAEAITGPEGGPEPPLPAGLTVPDRTLVEAVIEPARRDRVLVVRTTGWGDLSGYVLRLLDADLESLPEGLDPPLAQDRFSFAIDCPDLPDCRTPDPAPAAAGPGPVLDYLARDYPALRRRLLDRVTALVPGWGEETGADVGVMLVELMAHLGDVLAYRQDAAALEAYLTTARRRTSVRRHARLLGYPVTEGCSARTWLALTATAELDLEAGVGVADRAAAPDPDGTRPTPEQAHAAGAVVFETTRTVRLRPARNRLPLHAWSDRDHVLPAGTTAAFLTSPAGTDPLLRAGDVIVLAELPPGGDGDPANGDPRHRQAVRLDRDATEVADAFAPGTTVWEVRWAAEDALTSPLVVTERGHDAGPVTRAVALANVVLADAGATVRGEVLDQVPAGGAAYRPRLAGTPVAWVDPVDPAAGPTAGEQSARAAQAPDAARARAAVELDDGTRTWRARTDLLGSSALDAHLVVEPEDDLLGGEAVVAWLRLGDGTFGRAPAVGADVTADYRVGGGAGGNVAPGVLTEPLLRPDGTDPFGGGVAAVWNPLAATGGVDPESSAAVRQLAPASIVEQRRAVVTDDHRVVAEQVPGVQRAAARRRWTGSWHAVEVMVDSLQAEGTATPEDPTLPTRVLQRLEGRRMAATDVEVARPLWVPLLLELSGCAAPGYRAATVAAGIRGLLSARLLPDGTRGLFHPDRLTFGTPLRLSEVVSAAMAVPGVGWIEVTQLRRLTDTDAAAAEHLATGVLTVGTREVIRCDSDPNQPEFGRVEVLMGEAGGAP